MSNSSNSDKNRKVADKESSADVYQLILLNDLERCGGVGRGGTVGNASQKNENLLPNRCFAFPPSRKCRHVNACLDVVATPYVWGREDSKAMVAPAAVVSKWPVC
ncbi:hypothetical protein AVEN_261568-1 [Araneus ventricosus]|uniref:Uncharacterized protein n=1 Tax=Araneus ventricosus TaxID=182803 RepID=A0A4Y2E8K7_ARAVE|nr:hypothetical protein AVEN_261568-1 [Araneus ventricosus]